MKMTALKPIYLNRDVVLAGQEFDTLEQHGRELIKKGYAQAKPDALVQAENIEPAVATSAPETNTEALTPAADTEQSIADPAPETDTQSEAPAPAEDPEVKVESPAKTKTK